MRCASNPVGGKASCTDVPQLTGHLGTYQGSVYDALRIHGLKLCDLFVQGFRAHGLRFRGLGFLGFRAVTSTALGSSLDQPNPTVKQALPELRNLAYPELPTRPKQTVWALNPEPLPGPDPKTPPALPC